MADFIMHAPCPACGSSDGLAVYSDESTYCWVCKKATQPGGGLQHSRKRERVPSDLIEEGEAQALKKRGLSRETCEKWRYTVGRYKGKKVQIANYRSLKGNVVAQKVRFADKSFVFLGDAKKAGLYGQHLWRDSGRRVVITEGELDALSVSQLQSNRWPVVSVPNGAPAAAKAIREQLEWIEQFDEVIFCFDNDQQGQDAVAECAELLTPGKAKIAKLPLKDASDMLQAGRGKELMDALWGAKVFRPDGIVSGDDITVDDLLETSTRGYDLPYEKMTETMHGLRKGELTLFTAGTGVGKTTIVREIGYHLTRQHGMKLGNIFLEESFKKTAQGYVAIHHNIPLGVLREKPDTLTREQWEATREEIIKGRMHFYDHFGSLESENLVSKLRYLAVGLECDFIILDHISMVVSGQAGSGQGERKDIDVLMTNLRSLIEQTGVGILAIVHLKQPDGTAHEEGGRVRLSELRGSGTLKQIPDTVVALERDQQSSESNVAQVRVLKNREFGTTGPAGKVAYAADTGRLLDHHEPDEPTEDFANDFDGEDEGDTPKDF